MTLLLTLAVLGVTPGPGWSEPFVATEEPNSGFKKQFIARDSQGRFHLLWEDYKDNARIGYKVFLMDGTTVVPDTMVSRDTSSGFLYDPPHYSDSLFAFWREYNPVYYCIRSLEDGSEITPATYLFTEYTDYHRIRACPDSLGRLHTIRNIGQDVYYAAWIPKEGGGFEEEYGWFIPDAWVSAVLLVDGDRVHVVYQTYQDATPHYLQYDLAGNLTVLPYDFTADEFETYRFPELAVDCNRDLIVVTKVHRIDETPFYAFWKLDGASGSLLVDEKCLVESNIPEMDISSHMDMAPYPGNEMFYHVWKDGWGSSKKLWYIFFDNEGDMIVEPTMAYDYTDEDPEDLRLPNCEVDDEGNLYVIYGQGEEEPIFGCYPTFGWFDHNYLGIEGDPEAELPPPISLAASCNPFSESVTIHVEGSPVPGLLEVYDVSGRKIASLEAGEHGAFTWDGTDSSGEELPAGSYIVRGASEGRLASISVVKL